MNRNLLAALGGILLCFAPAAAPAGEPLPARSAPAGFHSTDGALGGRLLTGTMGGPFSSPSEALGPTLHRLRGYFTGPLPVSGAVRNDDRLIVFFHAHIAATPVVGMTIIAPANGGGARVAAMFDVPERAGASLRRFASASARAATTSGLSAPAAGALQRQEFPDGSGSIGVPAGWRMIGGNRGMVDLAGPDGAEAHVSIAFPVWDPRAGLADPTRMQLPFFADPVQAMVAVTQRVFFIRHQEPPAADILAARPVSPPLGAGRAALVHGRTRGPQPIEFVTLANSAPLSASAWMFYATTLSAPARRFASDYPTLLAAWKSYRADAAYVRSVQADTAATLREAADIVNGATQRSIVAGEQANAGVDNIINGQDVIETTADGAHWIGNADAARVLAQKYPEKYRVVPIDEYRSGDY